MDFVGDEKLKMMVKDNDYFVSKDLEPIVIFTEVSHDDISKTLSSEIQDKCRLDGYLEAVDFVSSYILEKDNIEKVNFLKPNKMFNGLREHFNEEEMIIRGKKRCR